MPDWIIPFLAGLVCGLPLGAALVIVLSAVMLGSRRSREKESISRVH